MITYDDFMKLDIRVGKVVAAEKVAGADKLLLLKIDLGNEIRQVVAGIAQQYTPDQLIGKDMVLLANLEPRTIRGVESNGMILAATVNGAPVILTTEKPVPPGSTVK
ncbi:MAG: methionine--tRNA ligase subunit beta [bacterium]|nr:methionine--tRNA ligase subunit beta [bacterium]